jgi:hypothetical protein
MNTLLALSWAITWYSPKVTMSQDVVTRFGALATAAQG